jgi:uncharacterized protein
LGIEVVGRFAESGRTGGRNGRRNFQVRGRVMRDNGLVRSWAERKAIGIAIFCLLLGSGTVGQQLVDVKSSSGGSCVEPCDAKAVENLARSGHAFAENELGVESALVLGPDKTIRDARKWFEKAARQGYAQAQVNLAVLYLNGWGVEKNYGTALYWLKAAAAQGNARAHTNLGILYMNGWGVRQDYAEAAANFRFAAEHGDTGAMVDLGYLSDGGLGTTQDKQEAAKWYRLAAEQGDALGENNLADLYLRGEGVPQSDVLAREWFEKAAAQGNTGARIKLGYLCASGRIGRADTEAAYAWILSAELAGDARGKEYLAEIEKQLSAEQVERAKEKARELLATHEQTKVELVFLR